MKQVKWFDRSFPFKSEQNIFPSIVERLWGTPLRLEAKMKQVPSGLLAQKPNGTWSIKENIGHLIDLEPLWQGRLEDIRNGLPELRPTDLQNTATDLANHNATSLPDLLASFRLIRWQTLDLLKTVDEALVFQSALHPRLKTPMRTMDLFLFVAEHDDHHLARITDIVQELGGTTERMTNN